MIYYPSGIISWSPKVQGSPPAIPSVGEAFYHLIYPGHPYVFWSHSINGTGGALSGSGIYSVWRGIGLRYQGGVGGDGVSTPQITTRSDT